MEHKFIEKRGNIIIVAIDLPAAVSAGIQIRLISKYYNLFNLDIQKIRKYIGKLKINKKNNVSYRLLKHKIKEFNLSNLKNKKSLSNEVAKSAFKIAKDKKIRNIIHKF